MWSHGSGAPRFVKKSSPRSVQTCEKSDPRALGGALGRPCVNPAKFFILVVMHAPSQLYQNDWSMVCLQNFYRPSFTRTQFSKPLLIHRLCLSNFFFVQNMPKHSIAHLFLHANSAPCFFPSNLSILVPLHMPRKRKISISSSLCRSNSLKLQLSAPCVTIGATTLLHSSIVTPKINKLK